MAKKLLLIDNEDLTESIATIEKLSRAKGFKVICHPLYVGLPDGNDVVDEETGKIKMSLVYDKLKSLYGNTRFHLIASDFNLNDAEGVDGIKMLSSLDSQVNAKNAKRILYSSQLIDIVEDYLKIYKVDGNFDGAWTKFKSLIRLNILDFLLRDDVEKHIVDKIEKIIEKEDDFIIEELLYNSDLTFNPSVEIYEGLTFEEIAGKILENDSQSINFKKKLIQLAISNISFLQNE
ncbi:hypothetical protein [Flavobacterium pedocola]